MSKNSTIYKTLIKHGIKKEKAIKIEKELVKKAKHNPMLTNNELKKEIAKLYKVIKKISTKEENETVIDYKSIINDVMASGVFELLVLLHAWLSSMFMSAPSPQIERIMSLRAALRDHVDKKFSSGTSKYLLMNAWEFEENKKEIIHAIILEKEKDFTSEQQETIIVFFECLIQVVEYKHAKELNLLNEFTTKQ